ncbi:carbohydrate ABC transporter ATP-binding protein, CUT1 family (TC 3.A.1.1.-) [Cohaesibacter sp. ES.047]|uniref:ABC transporter ATP-binding protein n=1 Tax=Cohaesibacter sp. ES.047 TaxID=1798205 RepID=UPI000BB90F9A|nr:ABC transporter ATP-binding protein [Cohaesibacter sp. ES.047]SNY90287.1 carbohydrate ABC transporter ATP-binding protein, CUT1 family (TC 3.A.1.1.-) [Cohaesibacter sp. ES.047]
MGSIQLKDLRKSFDDQKIIKGVNLEIKDGEFMVFVGPSGCGKSTLLRLIAGLEEVTSGAIISDGRDVTKLQPFDRHMAMVFQSYALYPHMTVKQNIEFALKTIKMPKDEIEEKTAEAARILKLEPYMDRKPSALSGGQRQRVAIGRAIVREPSAFLFDEPLSNLDAALRTETRLEIARLHETLSGTIVYVTHDQVEAMTLADRIAVLSDGQLMQCDTPQMLYERPVNRFVAQFIGSPKMNLLPASGENGKTIKLDGGAKEIEILGGYKGSVAVLGLRSEHLRLGSVADAALSGTVSHVEYLGADASIFVTLATGETLNLRGLGRELPAVNTEVGLLFDASDVHLFDAHGTAIRDYE